LDYYQLDDAPEQPPMAGGYRLPFSPITEESSSQLSPPAPYNRPDSRGSSIRTPGRYFFGPGTSASSGGGKLKEKGDYIYTDPDLSVRVDWALKRSSDLRPGSRTSISKSLLPPEGSNSPIQVGHLILSTR
jgi:hypothetical protein